MDAGFLIDFWWSVICFVKFQILFAYDLLSSRVLTGVPIGHTGCVSKWLSMHLAGIVLSGMKRHTTFPHPHLIPSFIFLLQITQEGAPSSR